MNPSQPSSSPRLEAESRLASIRRWPMGAIFALVLVATLTAYFPALRAIFCGTMRAT